jgi:DNA-binding GntR family transcriptional regulator
MSDTKSLLEKLQQNRQKTAPRLAEKAAEAIRGLIIANAFEPGEPLSEVRLAETLGISRTPVREAIGQLDQEGLLKIIPGRGAIVAEMTAEDIKEINDLRMVLEPLAAETAVSRVPDGEVNFERQVWENFLQKFESGVEISPESLSEADTRLHALILEYCDNNRLRNFLSVLRHQTLRYVFASWKTELFMGETIHQHLEIVRCLSERDVQTLKAALRAHIEFNNRYHLRKVQ